MCQKGAVVVSEQRVFAMPGEVSHGTLMREAAKAFPGEEFHEAEYSFTQREWDFSQRLREVLPEACVTNLQAYAKEHFCTVEGLVNFAMENGGLWQVIQGGQPYDSEEKVDEAIKRLSGDLEKESESLSQKITLIQRAEQREFEVLQRKSAAREYQIDRRYNLESADLYSQEAEETLAFVEAGDFSIVRQVLTDISKKRSDAETDLEKTRQAEYAVVSTWREKQDKALTEKYQVIYQPLRTRLEEVNTLLHRAEAEAEAFVWLEYFNDPAKRIPLYRDMV